MYMSDEPVQRQREQADARADESILRQEGFRPQHSVDYQRHVRQYELQQSTDHQKSQ